MSGRRLSAMAALACAASLASASAALGHGQLNRIGRRVLRVHRRGRRIKVVFTARDDEGNKVRHVRRTRLLDANTRRRP